MYIRLYNTLKKKHQARQPQHRKSHLRSRNVTQVTPAVSNSSSVSISIRTHLPKIRRDMRRDARGNDIPVHGSSMNSGRRHVMCKATVAVARPHSKNSTRATNMHSTVQHALILLCYLYMKRHPPV